MKSTPVPLPADTDAGNPNIDIQTEVIWFWVMHGREDRDNGGESPDWKRGDRRGGSRHIEVIGEEVGGFRAAEGSGTSGAREESGGARTTAIPRPST